MKILNEDIQNKSRDYSFYFDNEFIDTLSDQGYDINKIVDDFTDEVIYSDKYPNLSTAHSTKYSSIDEVRERVINTLVDIQYEVLAQDIENYDIEDIIKNIFWDNIDSLDDLEDEYRD